ncbi:uncharacterized protein LOC110442372 [Mizuhopecten yessoensis]|uniref:Uncharacterized protein n=1 Tax=Mizuhopecten yessoensis TaxID=6573 RepID=A0A210PHD5_MIZYE|nr:uncharacterized protein LOC110442372 [Mizuhopecten yessoensis]OWF35899.1 hypothetical protein KP79_PYT09723 [Mizuhopecten yessoensis]
MGSFSLCCFFLFTFFISMVLQTVGFFSPHWISWKDCDAQGLFYYLGSNVTEGCYGPGHYVSDSALALEALSFVMHWLVFMTMTYVICCGDSDEQCAEYCGCFATCCMVLYPVAGILSVVGCDKLSNIDISDYSYGSSYYMCLISGIYVIVQMAFLCYGCYKGIRDGDDDDSPQTTVATTQSSGQVLRTVPSAQHIGVSVTEQEDVHVSNGMMYVRRMRIARVVQLMR